MSSFIGLSNILNFINYICELNKIYKFTHMEKGTVKFFNNTKGFGFISEESSGKDYFVHSSGLAAPIKDGDVVHFLFNV